MIPLLNNSDYVQLVAYSDAVSPVVIDAHFWGFRLFTS
jgi:hypothetical protein